MPTAQISWHAVALDANGICGRDRVGSGSRLATGHRAGAVHVDAEDLPQQHPEVLRPELRVAAGAAVAQAHVEKPVGAELELTSVVVGVGVGDLQQNRGARGVGHVRVRRDLVARHRVVPVDRRVVDVEVTVVRVVGMEREAEQPLLAALRRIGLARVRQEAYDVQEGRGERPRPAADQDLSLLLHDEEAVRPVAGIHDADGKGQCGHEEGHRDVRCRLRGAWRGESTECQGAETPEYPSRESCSLGPQDLYCFLTAAA